MAPLSTRPRSRPRRSVVLLAGMLLPLPVLGGCGAGDRDDDRAGAPRDIAALPPAQTAGSGTLNWAVDALPGTLNAFQADADDATQRVAGAVLPALFTMDERGRPQRDGDFLRSAEVIQREPRQVVVYKLNPRAVWSDGRAIGVEDFEAQWKALRGQDSAYWTARNAGYDRIDRVERGADAHEVKVTFAKPYADWPALFTPLYPKSVMGSGNAFNDGARNDLKIVAGPFKVGARDNKEGTLTLERNPKWWGDRARLDKLVLRAVPRGERADALAKGLLDLADITPADAARIALANKPPKKDTAASKGKPALDDQPRDAATAGLRKVTVRKSLEPAYTQLALNGSTGPLADERVRKAVARAIDRKALAEQVLGPLGLPAEPLGSHVLLAGQDGYQDNSDAIGGKDHRASRALLADAGWREKGAGRGTKASGSPADAAGKDTAGKEAAGKKEDPKSDRDGGKAAPAPPARIKDGKKLTLRFMVPDGAGTEPLHGVADGIARQLAAVGVDTKISKVDGGSYFKDHIAAGDYDMALYSWPASAFPATDARPVFAKPQPAADGSLLVEQNYTRVGTDQIDQLFDQASTELDADASRDLIARADARIWAAAGSIPLFQRPELTGVRKTVVNAGAFGLATPRYQDLGFRGQAAG
ncbi:ABC transporter family substrate-binding protein [Streptomyces syringium]|uniref:ABC transporter family substrate-binding protein n=1 Tax=Streptomyces syringium TaxID=76729 RepID=UPI00367F8080